MRKTLSIFLAVLMLFTMIPLAAVSAGAETYGDFEYTVLDDGTVEITDYTGSATDLEIPAKIDGKAVTSIGSYAFDESENLTSVVIPDSVTSIRFGAFSWCNNLTSITIPDSVTEISDNPFYYCQSLLEIKVSENNPMYSSVDGVLFNKDQTEIICYPDGKQSSSYSIPDSVTSIGYFAFYYCYNLESVTIPSSVTSIGLQAFYGCMNLTNIAIPDSITSIGGSAFDNSGYYNDEDNWENDVLYISSYLIGAKNTIAGECSVKDGTTLIAESAFYGCESLTNVIIADSVLYIQSNAFSHCAALTTVTIPVSVKSIGYWVFSSCDSLTDIYYAGSKGDWQNIDMNRDCLSDYFDDVTIHYAITSLWDDYDYSVLEDGTVQLNGYYGTETELDIPAEIDGKTVTSIGGRSFSYSETITVVNIPASVTNIGSLFASAFNGCPNLTAINVDEDNENFHSIDGVLFNDVYNSDNELVYQLIQYPAGKPDSSYTVPEGVVDIKSYAFEGCTKLKSVTIDCIAMSFYVFLNCTELTSVNISAGVLSIGEAAFSGCTNLAEINVNENNEWYSSDNGVLFDKTKTYLHTYPAAKPDTSYTIPESVRYIGDESFVGSVNLTSITIPDSVTNLGGSAFMNCTGLESVYIGSGIESIAYQTFFNCISLENVIIVGSNMTDIGYGAFHWFDYNDYNYKPFENLTIYGIEGSFVQIYAQENEINFVSIFDTEVQEDGTVAITGYNAPASSISIPSTINGAVVTAISADAFANNESLTSITIPKSVTDIAPTAFDGCSPDLVIRGEAGSEAEAFANEHGITFEEIVVAATLGDVDGNGSIDSTDATFVLQYFAEILDKINITAADVDGNGTVDSTDATKILQYFAEIISSF